jgi:hypothetical protein
LHDGGLGEEEVLKHAISVLLADGGAPGFEVYCLLLVLARKAAKKVNFLHIK